MKRLLFFFLVLSNILLSAQDNVYKNLIPLKCDSLIKANKFNPDFVILDVRRPSEYIPQHLEGAINRNYFDSDFSAQLDSLDHNKIYLIHCHSGSRSGKTFQKMKSKQFKEVYNMQGGITAWKYASLPVTSVFYPKLMLVTDSIYPEKNIHIGQTDTIKITVTNRANDTLKYISSTSLTGTEFSTDFDITKTQTGAEDYTFNIFYQPVDETTDSLTFVLESNGGIKNIHIVRTGKNTSKIRETFSNKIKIYPNPAVDLIKIDDSLNTGMNVLIFDFSGKIIYKSSFKDNNKNIDVSGFQNGFYIMKIFNRENTITKKILISH